MNTKNFSFFILSDEISIKDGPVTITVDHGSIMSVVYFDHWDSLKTNEKEFAIWYQEQFLVYGLLPSPTFIVDYSLIEPYNQDYVCKQILGYLVSPNEEDSDIF